MTNFDEIVVHIIREITGYARDNKMSVDDTIVSIAGTLLELVKIATFEYLEDE